MYPRPDLHIGNLSLYTSENEIKRLWDLRTDEFDRESILTPLILRPYRFIMAAVLRRVEKTVDQPLAERAASLAWCCNEILQVWREVRSYRGDIGGTPSKPRRIKGRFFPLFLFISVLEEALSTQPTEVLVAAAIDITREAANLTNLMKAKGRW